MDFIQDLVEGLAHGYLGNRLWASHSPQPAPTTSVAMVEEEFLEVAPPRSGVLVGTAQVKRSKYDTEPYLVVFPL